MILDDTADDLDASLLLTGWIDQLRIALSFLRAEARVSSGRMSLGGQVWRRGIETALQEQLRDPLAIGARRWSIAGLGRVIRAKTKVSQ